MRLKEILSGIKFSSPNFRDLEVNGIAINSNHVGRNYMFIAVEGEERDGHEFIYHAMERGANVLVVEGDKVDGLIVSDKVVLIKVKDTKEELHKIARNFYRNPGEHLDVIGVTGTNGKTTITFLLERIFSVSGYCPALIGTICYKIGNREIPATNTTPDPISIQKFMREIVDCRQDLLLIEASSHGLVQGRLDGLSFDVAIFTNLGRDHLDYHKDMEDYFKAKCLLFQKIREGGIALINIDDPYGKRLWGQLKDVDKMSYGFEPEAEIRPLEYEMSFQGMHLKVKVLDEIWELYSAIFGEHNIYNILASIGVAYKYGLRKEKVIFGIESFRGVKGRLERVYGSSQLKVFVDYAHTPEALEKVLNCLSKLKRGKLWVVFGCGGNRYREKRGEMGKIASSIADKVIITTDNPRDENPMRIIDDILEGVLDRDKCEIIPDRRQAIEKVIAEANIDDVVLIAGKGHERFQIIGNLVIPFDDREIASRALIKRTMNELANVM